MLVQQHKPATAAPALVRTAARWMVLRTRSRQEKAVARYLAAKQLEHYLPLVERVSITRRQRFISRVPLFPGYVFLSGELDDGYGVMLTKRIVQIIDVRDQDRFIHEMSQIRRALDEGATLELHPYAAVGRRCRIRRGPFRGIEGIVVERLRPTRLILHIDILGRGAALEIDPDSLEPCD